MPEHGEQQHERQEHEYPWQYRRGDRGRLTGQPVTGRMQGVGASCRGDDEQQRQPGEYSAWQPCPAQRQDCGEHDDEHGVEQQRIPSREPRSDAGLQSDRPDRRI